VFYTCKIHNWNFRQTGGKGKAEIAFNGEIYQYEYPRTTNHQWVTVAEVTLKNGKFSIKHHLPEINQSKELWGLETNNFHKVNLVCLSPNHWGDNISGNLHFMFMLDNAKADTPIRGFHNENLIPEILKHRKVMEVLGATNMIEPSGKHLAGLGFNSTVKDELIVKCKGSFNRMLKNKILKQAIMYKEASKLKLRFQTSKGNLSIEQLWDLNLNELDSLAVSLEEAYKNSKGKSFLEKKTAKNKTIKLQFDIAFDILNTKVEEREALQKEDENKTHNQKIPSLIKEKQEDELKGKSIKELEKLLK
jgi:hypothetical protein